MKLIVGLGNPGLRFENTKHNIGFRVIDSLYDKTTAAVDSDSPTKKRVTSICNSLVIQTDLHDSPVILAKPMTYMNNSGSAVYALVNRFEIPLTDLLVVYDDVHLDIGVIRIRRKGSDGGQKGMQSIIHHLGSIEFPRLRIGIGEPIGDISDYVLSEFTQEEKNTIEFVIEHAVGAIETYLKDGVQKAMNQYNRSVSNPTEEK